MVRSETDDALSNDCSFKKLVSFFVHYIWGSTYKGLPDRRSIEHKCYIINKSCIMIDFDSIAFGYMVSAACLECTDEPLTPNKLQIGPTFEIPRLFSPIISRSVICIFFICCLRRCDAGVMDVARSRWFWFELYLRRDCCSEALNSSNLRSPRCTWKAFSYQINHWSCIYQLK